MNKYKQTTVNGKQIRVHRLIVSEIVGRSLKSNELVHHINGDITDNSPENLQIVTRSQHIKLHPEIGIKTRFKKKYNFSKRLLKSLYNQGMTIKEIAIYLEASYSSIWNRMKQFGIQARTSGSRSFYND